MYRVAKYHCNDELRLDTRRQNSIHWRIAVGDLPIVVVAKTLPHISANRYANEMENSNLVIMFMCALPP